MPDLFGLDIAGILNDAISSAGGVLDAQLNKRSNTSRTSGSVTAGRNRSEGTFGCKGFIDDRELTRSEQSLVETSGRIVTLLGASIEGGQEPDTDDEVTIEGQTYAILKVNRDPAAAVYECLVEA